ncbi:MAG: signal recognition particle protein [Bacteroidia bacterium]|nr:signal recognition particle protein [Bacteroidia bacterium]MDW8158776.1 signal recognition particle protein [Bacteroidia bacterium]
MFESLTQKLDRAFKTLRGEGKISEINVAETVREIRRALLDADVNYKVAKEFTDRVKEKALGQNVLIAVSPGQLMVKIVHDELVALMGEKNEPIRFSNTPPTIILMAGLQGSGKTTFSAKLARLLKSRGRNPLLVACDVYRPAAITQLAVLGEQINVEVYKELENKNPIQIAQNGIKYAKEKGRDVVIIDTAGRLAVDEEMMQEIENIKKAVCPDEILFVVDAMTGQDAVNTAKAFNERLDFSGVVLTKLDGDTRGGAAISIRSVVNKPIKFIGTGEKVDAIDLFHPDRMATRILGMGDVVTLVERAQEQYDREEAERLQKKIRKNQFDFNDFLSHLNTIQKMGNIKDLISMIPGVGKIAKDIDIDEDAFKHIRAIIQSMTQEERENPNIIDGSRRRRIAKGSGTSVQEVNQLLKQFQDMKKLMKTMNKMVSSGRDFSQLPFFKQKRR